MGIKTLNRSESHYVNCDFRLVQDVSRGNTLFVNCELCSLLYGESSLHRMYALFVYIADNHWPLNQNVVWTKWLRLRAKAV